MTETQQSICDWADATFGVPVRDVSIAARALKEMAELVTACAYGEPPEKIGEEIADVVIVLARLGRAARIDVIEIATVRPDVASGPASPEVAEAAISLAELHYALVMGETWEIRRFLRRACGVLARAAERVAVDLPVAIDAKMAVNRARRWRVDGTGHGAHVKEGR
jgi:hypothetical protein